MNTTSIAPPAPGFIPLAPRSPRHVPGPRPPALQGKRAVPAAPEPATAAAPPHTAPGDLLTVAEAAAVLSFSDDLVRRLIAAGHLPVVRAYRTLRIPRAAVEAFIAQGGVA